MITSKPVINIGFKSVFFCITGYIVISCLLLFLIPYNEPFFVWLVSQSALAAPPILWLKYNKISFKKIWMNVSLSKSIFYGVVGGVLCIVLATASEYIITKFLHHSVSQEISEALLSNDSVYVRTALIFTVAILAPFTEELFFRVIVMNAFLNKTKPAHAIWVTAVLFSISHREPWLFLPIFLIGVVEGVIYNRTRSLFPAVLSHTLNNISAVIILYN